MDINKNANLSMLCDYYELTMGNGYFVQGMQDRITYFDIFFRSVPDNGGFAIAAGLEQAIEYVQQLHFDEDDIAYLRSRKMFDEGFLQYLRGFRFTGDIWAVPEGTPVFWLIVSENPEMSFLAFWMTGKPGKPPLPVVRYLAL